MHRDGKKRRTAVKGLYRYLSPFSPDQSGAVSVFFEMGGLLVVLDAGGCTGNICGFDESRWFTKKSAVYSAGLRDMDAIFGEDDKLIEKLSDAAESMQAKFLVLIGTPVPAVIATDFQAIAKIVSKKLGIPTVYVPTLGMDTYEKGEEMAWEAAVSLSERMEEDRIDQDSEETEGGIGVFGALPLNMPPDEDEEILRRRLSEKLSGGESVYLYGAGDGLSALADRRKRKENLAVSPAAIPIVRKLAEEDGVPYRIGYPVSEEKVQKIAGKIRSDHRASDGNARVLIVHQQVLASSLRSALEEEIPELRGRIDVSSFFRMDDEIIRPGDSFLDGENAFIKKVRSGNYFAVIGDPLLKRAEASAEKPLLFIPCAHRAVSGDMFGKSI